MTIKIRYIINKIFIFFILLNLIQTVECKVWRRNPRKLAKRNEPSVKVSVIIPAFNVEQYIERSVKSSLNQTLKEIEVIVVDDNSTDKTLEILYKLKKTDSRLKVIPLSKRGGPAVTRNMGMKAAVGEFLSFVDSDDYVDERFLEYLYGFSKGYDLVTGTYVNSTNSSTKYTHPGKSLIEFYGSVYDSLWRREFIEKNNIEFPKFRVNMGEDIAFRKIFMSKNPRCVSAPDVGIYYYYKRRQGSIMNYSKENIDRINASLNEGK